MKNKSVKLPFMTKNSKHLVRTICSQMKNKSVKLQFVTKSSKHFVGTICSHMKNTEDNKRKRKNPSDTLKI